MSASAGQKEYEHDHSFWWYMPTWSMVLALFVVIRPIFMDAWFSLTIPFIFLVVYNLFVTISLYSDSFRNTTDRSGTFTVFSDHTGAIKTFVYKKNVCDVFRILLQPIVPSGLAGTVFSCEKKIPWYAYKNRFYSRVTRKLTVATRGANGAWYEIDVIIDANVVDAHTFVCSNIVDSFAKKMEDDVHAHLFDVFRDFNPTNDFSDYDGPILPQHVQHGVQYTLTVVRAHNMTKMRERNVREIDTAKERLAEFRSTAPRDNVHTAEKIRDMERAIQVLAKKCPVITDIPKIFSTPPRNVYSL